MQSSQCFQGPDHVASSEKWGPGEAQGDSGENVATDDGQLDHPRPLAHTLLAGALPRLLHPGDGSPCPWPAGHVDPTGRRVPLPRV